MDQLYALCEQLLVSPAPARIRYEIGCTLNRIATDHIQEYDFVNIFRLLNFYLPQTRYGFNLQIILHFPEIIHPDTMILFQAVRKPFLHIVIAHNLVKNLNKYLERWQPNPSLQDQYKRTALHVATWNVSINFEKQLLNIRTLLTYGFDPVKKWHRVTIVKKLEYYLQTLSNRKYEREMKFVKPAEQNECDTITIEDVIDQEEDALFDVRMDKIKVLEEKISMMDEIIQFIKLIIKTHDTIYKGMNERIKNGSLHGDTAKIIYELLGLQRYASSSNLQRNKEFKRIKSCSF